MNYRNATLLFAAAAVLSLNSCQTKTAKEETMTETTASAPADAKDAHSYANPQEIAVKHLDLNLEVFFDQKILKGTATYTLDRKTDAQ